MLAACIEVIVLWSEPFLGEIGEGLFDSYLRSAPVTAAARVSVFDHIVRQLPVNRYRSLGSFSGRWVL